MLNFIHKPVLLKETLELLNIKKDGIYIDCTAGGAGLSCEIAKKLDANGCIFAIDCDPDAIEVCNIRLKEFKNAKVLERNFTEIKKIHQEICIFLNKTVKIDGIILDLGLSSYQIDTPERGFSYMQDGPLDMRMSKNGISAKDIINNFSELELTKIIKNFGEERYAKKIASAICIKRKQKNINSTKELVDIIQKSVPHSNFGGHVAKKTFQALRIVVNDELKNFKKVLEKSIEILESHGRIATVVFHSLEDKIAKQTMTQWSKGCICPPDIPICACSHKVLVKLLTKKPIIPSQFEQEANPRSKCAKLRVCEKY
ncbi:MAG: 16S rRNA (cytosine(1402)-N(4))-methyltransferase RsmH [Candidatus Improbicoccus devescovinae]|nr:MAG: 16S rRNA (cytosine(1402)-N(4))-methyltransferase RsmH [Candidatus Improbicoccus devescovinae]